MSLTLSQDNLSHLSTCIKKYGNDFVFLSQGCIYTGEISNGGFVLHEEQKSGSLSAETRDTAIHAIPFSLFSSAKEQGQIKEGGCSDADFASWLVREGFVCETRFDRLEKAVTLGIFKKYSPLRAPEIRRGHTALVDGFRPVFRGAPSVSKRLVV